MIGGWAIWQVIEAASRNQEGIAYWAHVGGLATGDVLFLLLRPSGTRLFECAQPPLLQSPTEQSGYHGHLPPPVPPR